MIAVRAYFDGKAFVPVDIRKFRRNQEALIVVESPDEKSSKTCRGLAAAYANPALISKEESIIAEAFSGTEK